MFEFLRDNIANVPFHRWLMLELMAVDEGGSVTLRLPVRPEFGLDAELSKLHGGILAALIDISGHAAIAAKVGYPAPTIDMRVDYLRPASGKFILATSFIVKMGRTVSVADVRLTDSFNKLVALGRASYATSRRDRPPLNGPG